MSKMIFVYGEEKVKFDMNNEIYTSGALSSDVWKGRYFKLADEITFFSRKDDKVYEEREASQKFNKMDKDVEFCELFDNKKSIKSFLSFKQIRNSKQKIKEGIISSDIVLIRLPSIYGNYATKMAIKCNKKMVVEVVGCPLDSLRNCGIKGKILAIPSYLGMKKSVRKAKNVIYVTNEFLQKRYPNNNNNIGCSDVSLLDINQDVVTTKLDNIQKLKHNKKIILGTCGAIDVNYKGQKYVIAALEILKKNGWDNIEYELVGGGNNKNILKYAQEKGVGEKVKCLGVMPHEKIFDWLDSIDIYIQPSDTEGLSRALIEAMSRGNPCIASKVGGNPELIEEKYLFKKSNVNDLAEKILDLLNSNEKMYEQAKVNFEKSKLYTKKNLDKRKNEFLLNV